MEEEEVPDSVVQAQAGALAQHLAQPSFPLSSELFFWEFCRITISLEAH